MSKLEWRSVVTRNILEDIDDPNRVYSFRDKDSNQFTNTSFNMLSEEIKALKQCLIDIFDNLTHHLKLTPIDVPSSELAIKDIETQCKSIC